MGLLKWKGAESLCFDYLLTATQTVENVQGYSPRTPDKIVESATAQHWEFEMNGGEVQMEINGDSTSRANRCTHGMDAVLRGFFIRRQDGQDVASMVVNALPAGITDIGGITRMAVVSMPTISEALKPESLAGVEVQGWQLEIMMRVQMGTVNYDG